MYISSLDIFGFKSFAKKTTLKFGPGIAGIVGPNGCGKTNVVDAIRWVLGEQKTTVLRSDNMQDVIFNGSKSMKPLGMCEVSLKIHNNKGVLPVEFNDVVVTRRLYRDGQSEYLLNKQVCRLKDIHGLFVDTGMGADAYSVIELKMVEDILSDIKDERARMFEEAAGINKYKQERRSARRKLDATKEDLLRINDILYEIEKNVSSLKRQMRKYERYQRYKLELEEREVQYGSHRLWELDNTLLPLQDQLDQGKDIQSSSAEQLEIDEAIQDSLKEQIQEQEEIVEQLEQELSEVDEQRQEAKRNILVWQEQRSAARNTIERLEQENQNLQNRKTQVAEQIESLEADLAGIQPKLEAARESYQQQQERYQQVDQEYQECRARLNQLQENKIESITELADLRNKRDRFHENRDTAETEIAKQQTLIESLETEIAEKKQQLSELEEQRVEIEYHARERVEQLQQLKNRQEDLQEELESIRESLLKQETEEDVIRSKIEFYQELIENREGFSSAVQYLTGEHQQIDGIIGTVADIIQVKDEYHLAVENALGEQAEYLLAKDLSSARQAIKLVKEANRGRVSIIPIDMINAIGPQNLPSIEGFTNLVDYISCENKFIPVVNLLLGNVLVGKNLDSIPTSNEASGLVRYVTMDGEVMEQSGILRGGKSDSEYSSRVGRQDALEQLEKQFETIRQKQEATKTELSNQRELVQEIQNEISELEEAEQEQQEKSKDINQQITRLEYDINRSHQQQKEAHDKTDELRTQIREINTALESIEPVLDDLLEKRQQLQQEITDLEEELEGISEQRTIENNVLQDNRLEVASIENEQKTLQIRVTNARETIESIDERFENIAVERTEAQETVDKRSQALDGEEETLHRLEEQYSQLRSRRDNQREKLHDKQQKLREIEERIREKHRERETQFDRIRNVENQISELKSEKRSITERIRDRYGVEIHPEPITGEGTPEDISQEITSLQSRLDRLGPVNLAVKEEFEEEQERLNFLIEQRDDLLQAEDDLIKTIDRIDTQARSQFEEVFAVIRSNFHKTFNLFFPGGQADLILEGEEDPLDADIQIQASPGGKDLQSLRMLSAGEKTLTAIAILFAIYMYKPSPFCILDEVDAPLDDNNSQIFTRVLNEFSTDTQFIVVTHNKITMESANYMYGITMQDEGVSKVVSVNFE